jgi:DNA-binding CsgD family transcriptional regulator
MFNMRILPAAAAGALDLSEDEQRVLVYVADGLSPREIAERVQISEDELYRLVAWVLDELEPAPNGDTMAEVHERHGSRPARPEDVEEFERQFGPSLPADGEG